MNLSTATEVILFLVCVLLYVDAGWSRWLILTRNPENNQDDKALVAATEAGRHPIYIIGLVLMIGLWPVWWYGPRVYRTIARYTHAILTPS